MPFSSSNGKAWTKRLLNRVISDRSGVRIVDIGPGSGTYVKLLEATRDMCHWTGVEVWQPYVEKYQLNTLYDTIIVEDSRRWQPSGRYDIAIAGDVMEHMTKEEAKSLYERLLQTSDLVLMSIPIIHYPQGEYDGNPYEAHIKDDWSHSEVLETFGDLVIYFVEGDIGVYIGASDPQVKTQILKAHDPKIAVYGIFKNEVGYLPRMLESCADADQLVFCDTGSSDGSGELVRQFFKTNNLPGTCADICVSPWRFDDARNAALSMIDDDIDLCVSIDADEYLMPHWKKYLIDHWTPSYTRYYHRFSTIWSPESKTEHWHDRIHIRHGYSWKLPVHEILESRLVENVKWLPDFWMFQKPDMSKNRGSYLPLLEISVTERPDVWKSWTFLAQECVAKGDYLAADAALRRAETIPNADLSYINKLHFYYAAANHDYHGAIESIDKSISHSPTCREFYYIKAEFQYDNGNYVDAFATLSHCAKLPQDKRTDYHYDPRAYGESFDVLFKKAADEVRRMLSVGESK